jgi:hypothetical protein
VGVGRLRIIACMHVCGEVAAPDVGAASTRREGVMLCCAGRCGCSGWTGPASRTLLRAAMPAAPQPTASPLAHCGTAPTPPRRDPSLASPPRRRWIVREELLASKQAKRRAGRWCPTSQRRRCGDVPEGSPASQARPPTASPSSRCAKMHDSRGSHSETSNDGRQRAVAAARTGVRRWAPVACMRGGANLQRRC